MVYSVDEACELLAGRTGWPKKYSREELYRLMKRYLPGVTKAGKRYFLTEVEINVIENILERNKKRSKNRVIHYECLYVFWCKV